MLVKIKESIDGRWVIQALSGEHYLTEIAIAEAVYLRNARFGDRHITGTLFGSWEVEAIPEVLRTSTAKHLMVQSDEPPVFRKEAKNKDNLWTRVDTGETFCHKESISHLVAEPGMVTFTREKLHPVIKGVKIEPNSEALVEKKNWMSRLTGN